MPEELHKPEDVAPRLHTSAKGVRILCQTRQIRHIAIPRGEGSPRYLIPESAVAEYLQQHTVTTDRASLRRVWVS